MQTFSSNLDVQKSLSNPQGQFTMDDANEVILYRIGIATAVFNGVSCLCSIPAMFTYIRARNFPVYILFTSVVLRNLIHILNVALWPNNNVEEWWPGNILCDIEVKLILGCTMAVNSCTACILRQSLMILDPAKIGTIPTQGQKRWNMTVEVLGCIIIPCLVMCFHYIVQPQRYLLYPIHGCLQSIDSSWLGYALVDLWPSIAALIALLYAMALIYRLFKHDRDIKRILVHHMNRKERSRFTRLSVATSTITLFTIPGIILHLSNLRAPSYIYSWERVHPPNWSSTIILVPSYNLDQILSDLVQAINSFQLFLWFSHGSEVAALYKKMVHKIGFTTLIQTRPAHSSVSSPNVQLGGSAGSALTGSPLHRIARASLDEVDIVLGDLGRSLNPQTQEA